MTYGWTGKLLRVNLTTGQAATEDSSKYYDYLGGTGFGDRIMYEEVPVGTKPYDEANKLIYAVGPNTGTSSPCSGRTTITSLSTFTKGNMVVNAHMGGEFAVQLKYAGLDALIVEGKSAKPVYIKIENDKYSIEDAGDMWGKTTTRETSAAICKKDGQGFCVAAIGLAGENMLNQSCMINAGNHCGGAGTGGVMGSKNLKAVAVYGKGSVQVADSKKILELNKYVMSDLMGSNNNHVVPSTERPWAEYSDPGSRWTGRPGLTWGAAEGGPVDTGDSPPGEPEKMGYRCQKAYKDFGPVSEKYTVKMTGCTACPVRCSATVSLPELEKEGYVAAVSNTCIPNSQWGKLVKEKHKDYVEKDDGEFYFNVACMSTADDLGLWDNYGELPNTLQYFIKNNLLEKILPEAEYKSLKWDLYEAGDAGFVKDIMYRIAKQEGVLATLGEGAYFVNERYKELLGGKYLNDKSVSVWARIGSAKHHGNETAAQVGALTNLFFNRDCMCHTIVNITGSGLPYELQKSIIEERFGAGALDKPKAYTPVNQAKAKFAKFGVVKQTLHDSFTLCNWVWPMTFSPSKERGYKGDLTVEAQYMSAITGTEWTEESLDFAAERILQLQRALQVLWMNTTDMRNEHDGINDWVFDMEPDFKAFEEGCIKMDRDDMQTAYSMLYKEMGWDEKTGAPTRATLEKFGLKDVADKLDSLKLLP